LVTKIAAARTFPIDVTGAATGQGSTSARVV
jgi:hypothetical protein